MRKGLIVNPQFELVSVLHQTERVAANRKVEVESALVPTRVRVKLMHLRVALEDRLAILINLLLSRKHAIV